MGPLSMETNAAGYTPVTLAARLGSKVVAKLVIAILAYAAAAMSCVSFVLRHRIAAHPLARFIRGWMHRQRSVGWAGRTSCSFC